MTPIAGFGPDLFAPAAIDAETLAVNARIKDAEREAPDRADLDLAFERTMSPGGGALPRAKPSARVETRTISGPGGDLGLRVIAPAEGKPKGIYLHFHGGGFCLGSAAGQDPMLESMADKAQVVAISVDYRLAPEHPFPAGAADAEAATWWAIRHGLAEYGVEHLVLGGESAGANLSAVAAIRLRDRRGYTGLAGLNLSQGGYDLRMTPSMRAAQDAPIVSRATLDNHIARYLGGRDPEHPHVSPLLAHLADLAPALFTVGTADPTLDDSMFMYCRWVAAGNEAELAIYPGGVHGFTFLPTALGRRAAAHIESFVASCCATKD